MMIKTILIACFSAILACSSVVYAEGDHIPDWDKLANAIYRAEGGAKTRHPYGILTKYKTTTPRQACINTCKHKYKDWQAAGNPGSYLEYLASRYAPIGAANDPTNLNKNWLKNVKANL